MHKDASSSIFKFFDPTSLGSFEAASSKASASVARYKTEVITPSKIQHFINTLLAGLDTTNHVKEREILEKIKVQVDIKTITPEKVTIVKINIFTIRKLILEALKSLDDPTIENLKLIPAPELFEDLFEVLELYNLVKSSPDFLFIDKFVDNLAEKGRLGIAFEVANLLLSENTTIQDFTFTNIAYKLKEKKEWDKAIEVIKLIPIKGSRNVQYKSIVRTLIEANKYDKAFAVANLISDKSIRSEVLETISIDSTRSENHISEID
jgi:hypothetical protein